MRLVHRTTLAVMLAAVLTGSIATGASASAKGKVTATRAGSSPFYLKFRASGIPTDARGQFSYQEPSGYTISGEVTCYYQEGNRAVMTGPVTEETPFSTGTEALVVWVMDGPSAITGNPEGFDVAGTSLTAAADCENNFPVDRFDFVDPLMGGVMYYVRTNGDIVIR